MLRKFLIALTLLVSGLVGTQSAYAIGFYADVPLQYTFTEDCTQDCTYSTSGLKGGVVLPSNVGIGLQTYAIHDAGTTVDFLLVDVSYLLPIPVVNIMLGVGGGTVGLKSGGNDESGRATNLWASFGFPIIPLFDLHIAYHKVNAAIHQDAFTFDAGGNMISVGAMFNF